MSVIENKNIARRFVEDMWNAGNAAVAAELMADRFANHSPLPGEGPGRPGYQEIVGVVRAAFPDLRFAIDDLIAEGDRVVLRWTAHGTHCGDFLGIPATGRPIEVTGTNTFRVEGGKITELWKSWDRLGLLQQIGAIPSSDLK